jgi:hypothetical protein
MPAARPWGGTQSSMNPICAAQRGSRSLARIMGGRTEPILGHAVCGALRCAVCGVCVPCPSNHERAPGWGEGHAMDVRPADCRQRCVRAMRKECYVMLCYDPILGLGRCLVSSGPLFSTHHGFCDAVLRGRVLHRSPSPTYVLHLVCALPSTLKSSVQLTAKPWPPPPPLHRASRARAARSAG